MTAPIPVPSSRVVPHIWFDTQAIEAAEFYVRTMPDSQILNRTVLSGTPSGDVDVVTVLIWGQEFQFINAGPRFGPNPAVSFFLNCDPAFIDGAPELVDRLFGALADGGQVMMPLGEYPFSGRYGWVQDRFGVSWQVMLTDPDGDPRPFVIPSLMFTNERRGQAQAALQFYRDVFPNSQLGTIATSETTDQGFGLGDLMFGEVCLDGSWIAAMDGPGEQPFGFTEGISLMVMCDDQTEIDTYWDALRADGGTESQCGWVQDKFGVSWQVVPRDMDIYMSVPDLAKRRELTQAMLGMIKIDTTVLRGIVES